MPKPKKRKWQVTIVVVNDIRHIHGRLTRLVPKWRIKDIIRDEIENWRDLSVKSIKAKKLY